MPISISSETSPLAKEYARASTTVVDVFMKLIFTGYAHRLDARLREAGFTGDLNFADCAAMLLPWDEALEQPFRIVHAGPAAGPAKTIRNGCSRATSHGVSDAAQSAKLSSPSKPSARSSRSSSCA